MSRRVDDNIGKPSPRWAFMKWYRIMDYYDKDALYLKRLRVFACPWFGIHIHWIMLPDTGPDPHDHPYNFTTYILRGGYTQQVHPYAHVHVGLSHTLTMDRWRMFHMDRGKAHRVLTVKPRTVTLVVTGKRHRGWGFYTGYGYVPWEEYMIEN